MRGISGRLIWGLSTTAACAVVALGLMSSASASAADLPSGDPAALGLAPDRLAWIDKFMQGEIAAKRKAGAVVLVARHGKVAYYKAFGMADIANKKPMKLDAMVRMYSMTKPITAVALLTLYEQGKFQLTDPLEKYIPAFKNLKVYAGTNPDGSMKLEDMKRPPTIQDIFRHTGGFSYGQGDDPVDKAYHAAGINFGTMTGLKDLIDKLATVPLLYQPGTRWVYSVSADIQAYLVEYFSGERFDDYVRKTIFEPLGMTDATFGIPKKYVPRYAANYAPNPKGGLTMIENPDGSSPNGGSSTGYARFTTIPFGGLSLSADAMDYAKFAEMLVNGGELNGKRILGPKTVELMRTNNLPPEVGTIGGSPSAGGTGFGLGVSVLVDEARSGDLGSVGQFGWAGAATTWVIMDPKEDMVAILLAQYMPTDFDFSSKWQTLVYQALVN
jgi:CubicO group peptidase (beta-lactamase class C family)